MMGRMKRFTAAVMVGVLILPMPSIVQAKQSQPAKTQKDPQPSALELPRTPTPERR